MKTERRKKERMKEREKEKRERKRKSNPTMPTGKHVNTYTKQPRDASKALGVQKQQLWPLKFALLFWLFTRVAY